MEYSKKKKCYILFLTREKKETQMAATKIYTNYVHTEQWERLIGTVREMSFLEIAEMKINPLSKIH